MRIKQLLAPLLKKRPDLAYSQGFLLLVPFTHYARGVAFYDSLHSKQFEAKAFSAQMYDGCHTLALPIGDEKQAVRSFEAGWVDRPDQSTQELCDFVENEALPAIEMINNPAEHAKRPEYLPGVLGIPDSPLQTFALALGACYSGDFAAAKRHLRRSDIPLDHPHTDPNLRLLSHALHTDVGRIPTLMHEWEAFKIKETRIKEQYWKSAPFPCEERKSLGRRGRAIPRAAPSLARR